jgi:hypothetical protein
VSSLAIKVLTNDRKTANILHPDQISYGAVTATTSSAITALRFMQASTLTLDAFSGCYVGNSNRRAVGVLRQVITTIKEYDRCPSFFRSDRGKEVLLLADAQYSFYTLPRKATGTCPEDADTLNLRECYIFGTSTANIRIESSCMRMLRHQTKPWLVS